MTSLKKHIVYTFLAIFAATAIVGLSGVVEWIDVKQEAVRWVFGLLVAQCATVIVAIIKAPEYFAEPEAILKLKEEHLAVIKEYQDSIAKIQAENQGYTIYMGQILAESDPKFPAAKFRFKSL